MRYPLAFTALASLFLLTFSTTPHADILEMKDGTVHRDRNVMDAGDITALPKSPKPGDNRVFEGGEFAWIPPGTFEMGAALTLDELALKYGADRRIFENDLPRHTVTLSKGFWMATKEITNAEFKKFVDATGYVTYAEESGRGFGYSQESVTLSKDPEEVTYRWRQGLVYGLTWHNPARRLGADSPLPPLGKEQRGRHIVERSKRKQIMKHGLQNEAPRWDAEPEFPVVAVGYSDANAYCKWLSGETGEEYRLPTEAEWEWACRAGSTTEFHWGDDPSMGRGRLNASDRSARNEFKWSSTFTFSDGYLFVAPVGSFKPNAWGLYDMSGNVAEWCRDPLGPYPEESVTDPIGPPGDYRNPRAGRVVRGGAWCDPPAACRSAYRRRSQDPSAERGESGVGFRICRDAD